MRPPDKGRRSQTAPSTISLRHVLFCIILNAYRVHAQIVSQNVGFAAGYRGNYGIHDGVGNSLLSFRQLVRQRSSGNSIQQCPCVHLPGSNKCITYDSRFQAVTIEEAMISFVDRTMDGFNTRANSGGGGVITGSTFNCDSQECRHCVGILAIRLRQAGLLRRPLTFSFNVPGPNEVNPALCPRLRLSRSYPHRTPPAASAWVRQAIANGAPFRDAITRRPRSILQAMVEQVDGRGGTDGPVGASPAISRGPSANGGRATGRGTGPSSGSGSDSGRSASNSGGSSSAGSSGGTRTGGNGRAGTSITGAINVDGGQLNGRVNENTAGRVNLGPANVNFNGRINGNAPNIQGPSQQGNRPPQLRPQQQPPPFRPPQQQRPSLPQQSPQIRPQFPQPQVQAQIPFRGQIGPQFQPQFGPQFAPQGPMWQPQPWESGGQWQGQPWSNFNNPGNQFVESRVTGEVTSGIVGSVRSGVNGGGGNGQGTGGQGAGQGFSGSTGASGSFSPAAGISGGTGFGGGGGGGGGGFGSSIGLGVFSGSDGGSNSNSGGFVIPFRHKREVKPPVEGKRFIISCVERGDSEDEDMDFLNLCTLCWTWRELPENYFPRLLNELVCQDNEFCLSGWGECHQRYRDMDVLKKVGNDWRPQTISGATCCGCKVKAGSEAHSLVVGGSGRSRRS